MRVDLGVVGDVAVEDERRAEFGGELGDALLEALALVAEREFGAFAAAGPGDAVGDRAVGEHAGDQEALAGEKSHGGGASRRGARADDSGMQPGAPRAALDSRCLSVFAGADTIPLFPRKRQVGGFFQPIFFGRSHFEPLLCTSRSVKP